MRAVPGLGLFDTDAPGVGESINRLWPNGLDARLLGILHWAFLRVFFALESHTSARNSHPSRVLSVHSQGPGQSPPQEKENAPPVLLAPVGATAVAAHLSTRPSNAAAPATGRGSAEPTWLIPRVLPWRVYANSILLFFYCRTFIFLSIFVIIFKTRMNLSVVVTSG